jgi:polyisoprenoid-binding protein YceI
MTKTGYTKFFSSAPLEDIEAHNHQVQSIIDLASQEVVVSIPIRGFEFEKSLMQEHFNENYLESDKFPKASFQGVFTSKKPISLDQDGSYEVEVKGNLTIHGVTKPYTAKGIIAIENRQVSAATKFDVRVADHNIEIPKLVFKNIAEVVEVTVELKYQLLNS